MDIVQKFVVSCEVLGLEDSFQRTCFGHVFLTYVNMLQQMKFFAQASNMFLFHLHK
jgi:hypothetical protein